MFPPLRSVQHVWLPCSRALLKPETRSNAVIHPRQSGFNMLGASCQQCEAGTFESSRLNVSSTVQALLPALDALAIFDAIVERDGLLLGWPSRPACRLRGRQCNSRKKVGRTNAPLAGPNPTCSCGRPVWTISVQPLTARVAVMHLACLRGHRRSHCRTPRARLAGSRAGFRSARAVRLWRA